MNKLYFSRQRKKNPENTNRMPFHLQVCESSKWMNLHNGFWSVFINLHKYKYFKEQQTTTAAGKKERKECVLWLSNKCPWIYKINCLEKLLTVFVYFHFTFFFSLSILLVKMHKITLWFRQPNGFFGVLSWFHCSSLASLTHSFASVSVSEHSHWFLFRFYCSCS